MHHIGDAHHGKQRVTLAELFINGIGTARKTAKAFGIEPTDVSKWRTTRCRKKRGFGGDIPTRLKPLALEISRKMNLGITAEEILLGYGYRDSREVA